LPYSRQDGGPIRVAERAQNGTKNPASLGMSRKPRASPRLLYWVEHLGDVSALDLSVGLNLSVWLFFKPPMGSSRMECAGFFFLSSRPFMFLNYRWRSGTVSYTPTPLEYLKNRHSQFSLENFGLWLFPCFLFSQSTSAQYILLPAPPSVFAQRPPLHRHSAG
jgi:hypothetical protein